jgi:hypothetical protein
VIKMCDDLVGGKRTRDCNGNGYVAMKHAVRLLYHATPPPSYFTSFSTGLNHSSKCIILRQISLIFRNNIIMPYRPLIFMVIIFSHRIL